MNESSNRYETAWDRFWGSIAPSSNEVLWDVEPARAAALDARRFCSLMDPALPLIDLGCGNGTQSRLLARRFSRVVGVDVSARAIELARTTNAAPNVRYRRFDVLSAAEAEALHDELGDANVYMRGVMLQLLPEDRPRAARALRTLIGATGVLYFIEYSSEARRYFQDIFQQQGMPGSFARVIESGITPGGLSPDELERIFPPSELEVLVRGAHVIHTNILLADGSLAHPPALYMALRRR